MNSSMGNIPTTKASFCDMMTEARYAEIDLLFCIPLAQICDPTRYGVFGFFSIFTELDASKLVSANGEVACESNSAIAVQFEDCNLHTVRSYYALEDLSGTKVHRMVSSKCDLYKVVDGNYRHRAIIQLMDTNHQ